MYAENKEAFEEDLKADEEEANMSKLLAAAIVLDTYFFKEELRNKKWTEEDEQAQAFLAETADIGHDYWARLNTAKFDVQAGLQLGLKGIFIRDYKNYSLENGIMGVAVSTGAFDTLVDHFGIDKFAEASAEISAERNLGLFVVISIQSDEQEDGEVLLRKGITIFKPSQGQNGLTAQYDGLLALIEGWEDMQLNGKREFSEEDLGGQGIAATYNIQNTRYTRKAFEAIVKGNKF